MYKTLDESNSCEIVSFETTTTPNGDSCAPSVLQPCRTRKKLDEFSAIPSLRSCGKPLEPFR
jgi:hypothetical protein